MAQSWERRVYGGGQRTKDYWTTMLTGGSTKTATIQDVRTLLTMIAGSNQVAVSIITGVKTGIDPNLHERRSFFTEPGFHLLKHDGVLQNILAGSTTMRERALNPGVQFQTQPVIDAAVTAAIERHNSGLGDGPITNADDSGPADRVQTRAQSQASAAMDVDIPDNKTADYRIMRRGKERGSGHTRALQTGSRDLLNK